jgi:hypothetical protein
MAGAALMLAAMGCVTPGAVHAQSGTATPTPNAAQAEFGGLARSAWLGVGLRAVDGGAEVLSINPAASAARIGLMVGDVIVAMDGVATPGNAAVVSALRTKLAGAPVRIDVRRGGGVQTLTGNLTGRPIETFTNGTVTLGSVSFDGGRLRTIMATPTRPATGSPVVYFVQGVVCGSIESSGPEHIYARFVETLLERGIAVYRIEKAGMGDSRGGPQCENIDYAKELAGFAAGYDDLVRTHGVEPSRLFVFGHSMGGIQAPALFGPDRPVRGMAVMGTGMTAWQDYLLDLLRWQSVMQGQATATQAEDAAAVLRPLIHGLMNDPGGVRAVVAAMPEFEGVMRNELGWDGADNWMGRSSAYWRGVGAQRTAAAWEQVDVPVLVIHGGRDVAVVDHRDARRIAFIVNQREPGRATYVELEQTEHGFTLPGGRFDVELTTKTADWIDRVMADQ